MQQGPFRPTWGLLRLADGPYWTDERLSQASRGPVRLAGISQACRGPFWTKKVKTLKPVESISRLLRALTGYQRNFSGRRRALQDQQTTREKPIGDHLRLTEGPFRQSGGPVVPKRPSQTDRGPFWTDRDPFRPTVDPVILSEGPLSSKKRPFRHTQAEIGPVQADLGPSQAGRWTFLD